MVDYMKKLILSECPDYDFEQYRFTAGDCVKTKDNAIIVVDCSALKYVTAYVIRRGFKYNSIGETQVLYEDLPYYKKGKFTSLPYKLGTSLKWQVGEIRKVDDMLVVLYAESGHQGFYAFVLETANKYYLHTRVYVQNQYKDYIQVNG